MPLGRMIRGDKEQPMPIGVIIEAFVNSSSLRLIVGILSIPAMTIMVDNVVVAVLLLLLLASVSLLRLMPLLL